MRRALTGGYGLQYNKLPVEPQRWLQSIPGVWGIADVTHYRVLNRWPRSTIYFFEPSDITLYCDDTTNICFSWGWEHTDYRYIPEYIWEKSTDNGQTWVSVTQQSHDLSQTTFRLGHPVFNDARYQLDGNIDDVRLSIGDGRYFANFVLPPAHIADGQTRLLLRCDGEHNSAAFPDSSANNIAINTYNSFVWWFNGFVTGAQVTTFNKKYGSGSAVFMYNDNVGSVNYLTATDARVAPGTNDFCLEMWFYVNKYDNNAQQQQYGWGNYQIFSTLFDSRSPSNLASPVGFLLGVSSIGNIEVTFNNSLILRGPKIETQKWHHVAVSRIGNQWCLYLNGIAVSCYNGFFTCIFLNDLRVGIPDTLYRCRFKIGLRTYVTRSMSLRVRAATIIFQQNTPTTVTGTLGGYVDLTISAYVQEQPGRQLTYQWEVNIDVNNGATPWTILPGRTAPTLSIGPITNDNINQGYRCRVTCGITSTYSNTTIISVAGS